MICCENETLAHDCQLLHLVAMLVQINYIFAIYKYLKHLLCSGALHLLHIGYSLTSTIRIYGIAEI